MLKTVGNPSTRSGDQTINNGDLIIGTAGDGIDFSANTPAAGMTSQLLDWYEEGTWTPTVYFGGAPTGITYTTQLGRYQRIGRLVVAHCEIVLSSKGSATGGMSVGGLPYPNGSGFTANASVFAGGLSSISGQLQGWTANGSQAINIQYLGTGTENIVADTNCSNTSGFILNLSYTV